MHPMFVKLYMEPGADDVAEEEDRHRAANRARRGRARPILRAAPARDRAQQPRR